MEGPSFAPWQTLPLLPFPLMQANVTEHALQTRKFMLLLNNVFSGFRMAKWLLKVSGIGPNLLGHHVHLTLQLGFRLTTSPS